MNIEAGIDILDKIRAEKVVNGSPGVEENMRLSIAHMRRILEAMRDNNIQERCKHITNYPMADSVQCGEVRPCKYHDNVYKTLIKPIIDEVDNTDYKTGDIPTDDELEQAENTGNPGKIDNINNPGQKNLETGCPSCGEQRGYCECKPACKNCGENEDWCKCSEHEKDAHLSIEDKVLSWLERNRKQYASYEEWRMALCIFIEATVENTKKEEFIKGYNNGFKVGNEFGINKIKNKFNEASEKGCTIPIKNLNLVSLITYFRNELFGYS